MSDAVDNSLEPLSSSTHAGDDTSTTHKSRTTASSASQPTSDHYNYGGKTLHGSSRHDTDLPGMPLDGHSFLTGEQTSFLQGQHSDAPSDSADSECLDERELRRHFMDVESSFLPDVAAQRPLGLQHHRDNRPGADDTYLELGKSGQTSPAEDMSEVQEQDLKSTKTLRKTTGSIWRSNGDSETDETSVSSPAQAASRRSNARVPSTAASVLQGQHMDSSSRPGTPMNRPESQSTARPGSKGSTIRPDSSHDSSSISGHREGNNFRQASYRSVNTTNMSSEVSEDESAADADSALQSGGAVIGGNILARSRADLLARLPSFASAASQRDWPETPRTNGRSIQPPTETVLAQRVESIQVPETIARDFRARNRSFSPDKRPVSAGGPGTATQDRNRRTLTLKEQNNKVDKLTKENFDLKLKIHFLDQALQSRSDDGVKELIDKNVQLQTDLANERKESQTLRRKVRELERTTKEQHDQLLEARLQKQDASTDEDDPTLQAEMHQEILYLRQQLDRTENQVTTLREEVMTKELEKRKMADHMRSMAGNRSEDTAGIKETMDMWQDLLNAETGRREQAEDDLHRLREELHALRLERAPAPQDGKGRSRSTGELESEAVNGLQDANVSTMLVEELRHEIAELRRDLGAQTNMLTSRNREREKLQQEIEELKLLHRKGDGARSIAGDSIFDRSISRAQARPSSRGSEWVQGSQVTDAEREQWEQTEGQLRDQNSELKLKYQELERTHQTHLQYTTTLESDYQEMENDLHDASEDLKALQTERDELITAYDEKEAEYKKLEDEALTEIDKLIKEVEGLETRLQETLKKAQRTQTKLDHTSDAYRGLQGELREITQSVMNLEDEKQANLRNIQTLEQQLAEAEEEIQVWEQKYNELHEKHRKLEITHESVQSEKTFLREEQESDKIRIGELEDALNAAHQTIQDEQEKQRDMEESMVEERQQRDVLENKSKEDVQKVLDDLNRECGRSKDEVRKLRRGLSAKEVEASSLKQKMEELESNLRFILGQPEGTKQSLLGEIERVQRELESTANQLDRTRMEVADKDRLLRHRDGLLESSSLESRRLSDLLDKERASRRHDLEQFEKSSRGQATHMRQAAQQESRILELETAYSQDKRRMAAQEEQYREQLEERNHLLLALWNRLSTLCGVDWCQQNSLVNGEVPSIEVIARGMTTFNRNILAAVETVEALIGNFKARIRSIEKELTRDYQTLEHNLDIRTRRIEELELALIEAQDAFEHAQQQHQQQQVPPPSRAGTLSKPFKSSEETLKLKNEIKLLKAELKFHRQHPSAMASQMLNQHNQQLNEGLSRRASTSAGSGRNQTSPARGVFSLLSRHSSNNNNAFSEHQQQPYMTPRSESPESKRNSLTMPFPPTSTTTSLAQGSQSSDQKWIHRLRELERRLQKEREGRLLDRKGARQRLEDGRLENEELRQMLDREKSRRELMAVEAERVMSSASHHGQEEFDEVIPGLE